MNRFLCWLFRHRECDVSPLRFYDHLERRWYRITRKVCMRCDRLRTVDMVAL